MKKIEVSSTDLIPEEKYPVIATDIAGCQIFSDGVSRLVGKLKFSEIESEVDEQRKEETALNKLNRIKDLQGAVATYTVLVEQELNPDRKKVLEAKLNNYQGQLTLKTVEAEVAKKSFFAPLLEENIKQSQGSVYSELLEEAMIDYLNDFVVPGNIGEGTVTFQGVEYVAEAVTG
ncbi:hypothetical protein FUAX_05270 [Fulvitalea axinellae]|uniref:Uncharacterized protein n=1 Tax=Fulvitalea axinellae TaxID=1182444 RepID=A0AAU9DBB5_9BACT|nr:hypothetical protein FUAX_05270 [Fulvitalea axinellae]